MSEVTRDEFNELKSDVQTLKEDVHELKIDVNGIKKDVDYIKIELSKITDRRTSIMLWSVVFTAIGTAILLTKYIFGG